jgi:hypothetical protein
LIRRPAIEKAENQGWRREIKTDPKKYGGMVLTGFFWVRIETSGRLL